MSLDEQELIDRLKKKDNESFLELVDKYKKKVVSLCYSFTENLHDAEDLSQEVFISFYKNINKFRGDSSLSTYIYKITVTKCIDFKRKRSFKNFLSGLFAVQKDSQEDMVERSYIRQCIKNLPEDMRTCIILYYYIGLSQKEISNILETSEKAIEGKIYRAKQKLKKELQEEGYSYARETR